jgi:hypothetical protein
MASTTTIIDNPGGSAGAVNFGVGVALTIGDQTFQLGMETAIAKASGPDVAMSSGAAGNTSATAVAFGPFPTWSVSNSLLTGGLPVILPLVLFSGGGATEAEQAPWTMEG